MTHVWTTNFSQYQQLILDKTPYSLTYKTIEGNCMYKLEGQVYHLCWDLGEVFHLDHFA